MKFQVSFISALLFSFVPAADAAQWMHAPLDYSVKNYSKLSSSITTSIQPPSGSTLLLGRGFNSISGSVGGPCVESGDVDTIKSNPTNSFGQKVTYTMQEIQSMEDLQQQLDISLSGTLGLGVWNADLKSKYYRSNTFSNNNYSLILRVTVENQTEIMKDYKLTQSAVALYARQGKEAFLKACGDQFVAARVTGGEFIAILEIETHSQEEKQTISAEVNAGKLYWTVAPKMSAILSNISKKNNTSVSIFRAGDSGPLPGQDPQKLIEYALNFPSKVKNQSGGEWPFMVSTESYDSILNKPGDDFIQLDSQQRVIAELSRDQEIAKSSLNELEYALSNPSQFVQYDTNQLSNYQTTLKGILRTIQDSAQNCASNLLLDCKVPSFTWPKLTLPSRAAAHSSYNTIDLDPSVDSGCLFIN